MIKDNIKNAKEYYYLGENFQKGFEYLENTDILSLENGKYEIEGEDIFVSVGKQDISVPHTAPNCSLK